jgi:DNA modification methylase
VIDPFCGSGTTIDVCRSLGRPVKGFDLVPRRPDIQQADARRLPLEDQSVDFVFMDPPYSTHIDYSDSPDCIGRLDAGGEDGGRAYYAAMSKAIEEAHRVLKNRRYMALYVSDSWRKKKGAPAGSGAGTFMPIGFELFAIMRRLLVPVDIVCVVRQNQKLDKGNWRKTAVEENFFLRGFNYLLVFKRVDDVVQGAGSHGAAAARAPSAGRSGRGPGRGAR